MAALNPTSFLADSQSPRIAAVSAADARLLSEEASKKGFKVWKLDGRRMRDDASVFDHFSEVMEFPDYFGRNWDAMDECLRDMDWAPHKAHLLVISDADALFLTARRTFVALLDSLRFVSRHWHEWQDGKTPFKILLVTSNPEIASFAVED